MEISQAIQTLKDGDKLAALEMLVLTLEGLKQFDDVKEYASDIRTLANFASQNQKWTEAAILWRCLCEIDPHGLAEKRAWARAVSRLDPLQSYEIWSVIHTEKKDDLEALRHLAQISEKQQNWLLAATYRAEICRVDPTDQNSWLGRARSLAKANDEGETQAWEDVHAHFPENIEALRHLGNEQMRLKNWEAAFAYFERALAVAPEDEQISRTVRNAFLANGEFGRWAKLLPNSDDVKKGLGLAGVSLEQVLKDPNTYQTPQVFFPKICEIAKNQSGAVRLPDGPAHIALVTSTLGAGGAERQMTNLALALAQNAERVGKLTVLVRSLNAKNKSDFFLPVLQDAGIEVVEYGEMKGEAPEFLSYFPPNVAKEVQGLYVALNELKPDVVHAWQDTTSVHACCAALLAGLGNVLMTGCSFRPQTPARFRPYLKEAYQQFLSLDQVRLSNNSHAGLRDYEEWIERELSGIPIIYNGVDLDKFKDEGLGEAAQALRMELDIPEGAPVIGGVLRFDEVKRPLMWVETAAEVLKSRDEVHFVLVGDGPLRQDCEALGQKLGLEKRLHFTGRRQDVPVCYKMMDICLLTSKLEGCPNVLLEAQILGVPVVAPDVGGMAEAVEHSITGWVVEPEIEGLVGRLAERLLYILQDAEWQKGANKRAPQFIKQNFANDIAMQSALDAYNYF